MAFLTGYISCTESLLKARLRGKLRITLCIIQVPVNYGYHPQKLCAPESGYREKALKLFPWVCGRCSREFVYSNLRELTVHHIDHDHTNNPEDGSNWELLCLYCHDHEHSKYTEADQYGSTVIAGEDAQKMSARRLITRLPI